MGAVFGCLLAGYYLLRNLGMTTATLAAVAINLAGAALAWVVAPRMAPDESQEERLAAESAAPADSSARMVYQTIALSKLRAGRRSGVDAPAGLSAAGYGFMFSPSFWRCSLAGLAVGSAGGSWLLKRVRPVAALGWCQGAAGAGHRLDLGVRRGGSAVLGR